MTSAFLRKTFFTQAYLSQHNPAPIVNQSRHQEKTTKWAVLRIKIAANAEFYQTQSQQNCAKTPQPYENTFLYNFDRHKLIPAQHLKNRG